jgi:hypothetical protein
MRARSFAWAVTGLMIGACDPTVRVTGVVRGVDGKPLADVTVTVQAERRGPHVSTTAPDGSFAVGVVGAKPERTKVSFQRAGYQPLHRVLGAGRPTSFTIVLEPATGP